MLQCSTVFLFLFSPRWHTRQKNNVLSYISQTVGETKGAQPYSSNGRVQATLYFALLEIAIIWLSEKEKGFPPVRVGDSPLGDNIPAFLFPVIVS